MRTFLHKNLAAGRWFELSLVEQLANIGSEVRRAAKWQKKDEELYDGAIERALELFDLTLEDKRWMGRSREINRLREVFCDAILGGNEYNNTLKGLEKIFICYAMARGLSLVAK